VGNAGGWRGEKYCGFVHTSLEVNEYLVKANLAHLREVRNV